MRVPAARLHINLHIARHGLLISKLQDRAAKIRPAFDARETRMQHAERLAAGRFQFAAPEPLVLPDGLQ